MRNTRRPHRARGRPGEERHSRVRRGLLDARDATRRAHHERLGQAGLRRTASASPRRYRDITGPRYASAAVVDARSYSRNSGAISCDATTCACGSRRRSSSLTARSCSGCAVGVQQAHGDRLRLERPSDPRSSSFENTVRPHPFAHAERTLEGNERLRVRRAEPVEMSAGLSPEVEDVLESGGCHQGGSGSRPFEERVRRDRRSVREAVDAIRLRRPARLRRPTPPAGARSEPWPCGARRRRGRGRR